VSDQDEIFKSKSRWRIVMKKKLVARRADGAARQDGVVPLSGGNISTRRVAEVEARRRGTARTVSIDMMIVGRIPGVVR
jgi:hypothetical protein